MNRFNLISTRSRSRSKVSRELNLAQERRAFTRSSRLTRPTHRWEQIMNKWEVAWTDRRLAQASCSIPLPSAVAGPWRLRLGPIVTSGRDVQIHDAAASPCSTRPGGPAAIARTRGSICSNRGCGAQPAGCVRRSLKCGAVHSRRWIQRALGRFIRSTSVTGRAADRRSSRANQAPRAQKTKRRPHGGRRFWCCW